MKSDRASGVQYAALPWRREGDGISILLLTSRETRRWVAPKGWPMFGCEPPACAAQEAFEEGGIRGRTSDLIGTYEYDKRLKDGSARTLTVEVYPLEVEVELEAWPEKFERKRQWFSIEDAAQSVDEPGLADLIRAFSAPSVPPQT